jgi:hypothetical protein
MSEHTDSQAEPNVEPTYHVLDDRAEDPDAFAHDPSAEANHVQQSMNERWGGEW